MLNYFFSFNLFNFLNFFFYDFYFFIIFLFNCFFSFLLICKLIFFKILNFIKILFQIPFYFLNHTQKKLHYFYDNHYNIFTHNDFLNLNKFKIKNENSFLNLNNYSSNHVIFPMSKTLFSYPHFFFFFILNFPIIIFNFLLSIYNTKDFSIKINQF